MIETLKSWSGVVALVILAIMGFVVAFKGPNFGTAVDCSGVTCFTTVGILTSLQDDGTAIFNGAVTLAGTVTHSGVSNFSSAVYASSTLQVSGTQTNYGLTTLTGTTTLGAGLNMTKPVSCIGFFPTSTATAAKLTYVSTSTNSSVSDGVLGWSFGSCN